MAAFVLFAAFYHFHLHLYLYLCVLGKWRYKLKGHVFLFFSLSTWTEHQKEGLLRGGRWHCMAEQAPSLAQCPSTDVRNTLRACAPHLTLASAFSPKEVPPSFYFL
jgi:hypothetical protein